MAAQFLPTPNQPNQMIWAPLSISLPPVPQLPQSDPEVVIVAPPVSSPITENIPTPVPVPTQDSTSVSVEELVLMDCENVTFKMHTRQHKKLPSNTFNISIDNESDSGKCIIIQPRKIGEFDQFEWNLKRGGKVLQRGNLDFKNIQRMVFIQFGKSVK